LGCGAAAPTPYFLTTSQVVNIHDHLILIDCGEGTQLSLKKRKIKFQRIKTILISHMHADHTLGLPGLIASMNLLGRKQKLDVYGPEDLGPLIKRIWHSTGTHIDFEVEFHITDQKSKMSLVETDSYKITSFPTKHRIPTCGFRIEEKFTTFNLKASAKEKFKLTLQEIIKIKRGVDVVRPNGEMIPYKSCCLEAPPQRSYVFAADTAYSDKVIEAAKNASLLYHEATFESAEAKLAKKTMHSTSEEAARVALKANVGKLIIGHFSQRYHTQETLLEETRRVFKNSELAVQGKVISIQ